MLVIECSRCCLLLFKLIECNFRFGQFTFNLKSKKMHFLLRLNFVCREREWSSIVKSSENICNFFPLPFENSSFWIFYGQKKNCRICTNPYVRFSLSIFPFLSFLFCLSLSLSSLFLFLSFPLFHFKYICFYCLLQTSLVKFGLMLKTFIEPFTEFNAK